MALRLSTRLGQESFRLGEWRGRNWCLLRGNRSSQGSPGDAVVKNPPANVRDAKDVGSILGSGRSPGGGNGNPLQYSYLENPMDRGAWWTTVHGVAELNTTEQLSTHTHTHTHTLYLHNEEDRLWSHIAWTLCGPCLSLLSLSQYCFCFMFCFLGPKECVSLLSQPGIKPAPQFPHL